MAELIAVGTTEITSADFTVAAGAVASLYIKPEAARIAGAGKFILQHKDSGGTYTTIGELNAFNIEEMGVLSATGTFRIIKKASTVAVGLDKE